MSNKVFIFAAHWVGQPISMALEFAFAGKLKVGAQTFVAWSALRAHLQSLVPKFFAAGAEPECGVGDSLMDALGEDIESPSKKDVVLGSPQSSPLKPLDALKSILSAEARLNDVKNKLEKEIVHSSPIRTHMLMAKFRAAASAKVSAMTVDAVSPGQFEQEITLFCTIVADAIYSEDIFSSDLQVVMKAVNDSVVKGDCPDWMPELIPIAQIPYFQAIRERYVIEFLHENLADEEGDFFTQPTLKKRWDSFVKSCRKPPEGKTAIVDLLDDVSKLSASVDKGTYVKIWFIILTTELDHSCSKAFLHEVRKKIKGIITAPNQTLIKSNSADAKQDPDDVEGMKCHGSAAPDGGAAELPALLDGLRREALWLLGLRVAMHSA